MGPSHPSRKPQNGLSTKVTLNIVSGGAAQGLVRAVADDFESLHSLHLSGTFGAVGAMKQKLTEGAPCDVLILTHPMVQELIQQGHASEGTALDLGVVKTGVAVLAGQAPVAVATPDALRQTLRQGRLADADPRRRRTHATSRGHNRQRAQMAQVQLIQKLHHQT